MLSGVETTLLVMAAVPLALSLAPRLRPWRTLLWAGSALALITAFFPRPGSTLGSHLLGDAASGHGLPAAPFIIAWWILGAWLLNSVLDRVLRRTLFPQDDQPHARRLFADLAAGLIYVVAFAGIMDTVFQQPISTVLATSGLLAIVLGLAMQNTLADVFSGLALNIERPFGAGDWITVGADVEGQVVEINWRATRLKTALNDLVVIPNSVVAKATVKNHRRLNAPHVCTIGFNVSQRIPPARVVEAVLTAVVRAPGMARDFVPFINACRFDDAFIGYELLFGIDDFTLTATIQSPVITCISAGLSAQGIVTGRPVTEVHVVRDTADDYFDGHAVPASAAAT